MVIIGSSLSTFVLITLIILWRRRKHCCSNDKTSTTVIGIYSRFFPIKCLIHRVLNVLQPSPLVLKRNVLVAERYAPNPQYSACNGTTVPVLKRETLKFLNEIGEGCFGKVFKGKSIDLQKGNLVRITYKKRK